MDQPDLFLEGWRSLPDELKLHVLSFALPSGIMIHEQIFNKAHIQHIIRGGLSHPSHTHAPRINSIVLPFLATAELSQLATEVFYKQNTVNLLYNFCRIPPRSVRTHIKRMKINFCLDFEMMQDLRNFFHGQFDFISLKLVELDIEGLYGFDRPKLAIFKSLDPIRVRTEELRVSLMHHEAVDAKNSPREDSSHEDEIAAAVLLGFTTFSKKDVQVKIQRYIYKDYDWIERERKHKVIVETWVGTRKDNRVTERVVKML